MEALVTLGVPPLQIGGKLTMKQKKLEEDGKLVVERNDKGEVIMPRYNCVTTHTQPGAVV